MRTLVLALALLFATAPVAAAAETSFAAHPGPDGVRDCTGLPCDAFCAVWDFVFGPPCPIE
jgi:hypothetical protein